LCFRVPCGERHSDSLESVALRGAVPERESRSLHEDGGRIQLAVRRGDDPMEGVLGKFLRRGAGGCAVLRQQAARSAVLHSRRLGPCSPASLSNDPRRKRWSHCWVARKQHSGGTMVFEDALTAKLQRRHCVFGRAVTARGLRDPSSRGDGRRVRKDTAKRKERFQSLPQGGLLESARESDVRECVRASEE